ncbi:polysaccharide deacetylase family protein [Mycolicibacterium agri]|nr:polysaccharide deacetylase family protein [Mycolicibacterium agri]
MRRVRAALWGLPFIVAVAAYLVLPGALQWRHAAALAAAHLNIVEQVQTEVAASDPVLAARLAAASTSSQAPPIALTYHDIGYHGDKYTVTPEAFAAHMQLIHDAGWTTLTSAQIRDWLRGTPLPPHSVMITFDDGARGVWKYADPILARHNQHATAFVITGFVGTHAPYYMTWDELTRLHASGRWDLEAHTHLGHVQVPASAEGENRPFLTTLQYLPEQRRVETSQEYRARVEADLKECKNQFVVHGLPEPTLFAFPFSAHQDDAESTEILQDLVTSNYAAGMLDQADAVTVTTSDHQSQGNIARMDMTYDVTPEILADRMIAASPLEPAAAQPLSDTGEWMTSERQPASVNVVDGKLILDPGAGRDLSLQYARYRSSMWDTYTVSADIGTFTHSADGTTTGLTVLVGDSRHEVQLSVSSQAYHISQGYRSPVVVAAGPLPPAPSYHAVIAVTPEQVVVTIDDQTVATVPVRSEKPHATAGGISVSAHRKYADSPVPVIANLEIG